MKLFLIAAEGKTYQVKRIRKFKRNGMKIQAKWNEKKATIPLTSDQKLF